MLSETKYKLKRYILKIRKIQNGEVLPLQRNIPSICKNWGFPLAFQNLPEKKGLYSFYSTHNIFAEKKTLKSMGANINGISPSLETFKTRLDEVLCNLL